MKKNTLMLLIVGALVVGVLYLLMKRTSNGDDGNGNGNGG